MNKLLSKKDIQNDLVNLNGWIYYNNKIKKDEENVEKKDEN